MTQLATSFNVTAATANGNAPSGISGVSIATNGSLTLNFANGRRTRLRIPLANVVSPDNLIRQRRRLSCDLRFRPCLYGNGRRRGLRLDRSSSLESSTVDLATELTKMIQAQSAYEANSKVFQTGANILDILNGLKP